MVIIRISGCYRGEWRLHKAAREKLPAFRIDLSAGAFSSMDSNFRRHGDVMAIPPKNSGAQQRNFSHDACGRDST